MSIDTDVYEIRISETVNNLESRIDDLELRLIEYMEKNPKHSDDWIEARLRALEESSQSMKLELQSIEMGLDLIILGGKEGAHGKRPKAHR